MPDTRLQISLRLPFASTAVSDSDDSAAQLLGAHMYLKALNQMETSHGHGERGDPGQERLEAKLDLMLHWLGQALSADRKPQGDIQLILDGEGLEWQGDGYQPRQEVILDLHLSALLAAPLRLPARIMAVADGRIRAGFTGMDEDLRDLWSQWLFRQHRRAIHAARDGA